MADSEIIRSFLVSVGVQTDEKGLKRFDKTVDKITKTVTGFAEALGAAALAASAAVVKISGEFEDLYYASQRLRSSADNIKAFSFGISQMGGDARSARASLESFASFMRSNPMGEGYLRGLGVETRDAAGGAREYADVLRDLGAQLRKMPYWAAKQRASMLGIDESTLQALLRGTDLWSARYRKLVEDSGVDMDKMSADMTNLMQSFRLMRAQIEIYFYKAISKLNPEVLRLSVTLAAVGGALALVATFVSPVVALVVALAAGVALLADDYASWKAGSETLIDWGAWGPGIEAALSAVRELGSALGELGAALSPIADAFMKAFGPVLKFAVKAFLAETTAGLLQIADAIRVVADLLRGDFKSAAKDAAKFLKDGIPVIQPDGKRPAPAPAAAAQNDNMTPAQQGSANDAMGYFMRQGWTKEQAAGIVANGAKESKLRSNAVGDSGQAYGAFQWHADRQADFKAWAGKDIRQSSLAEQFAFVNYELTQGKERAAGNMLRRSQTASQAGGVVSSMYERPKSKFAEMSERGRMAETILAGHRLGASSAGGATVNINSKTEIKVQGGDAKETGKAVGAVVDQKNAALVRNTKGAIR